MQMAILTNFKLDCDPQQQFTHGKNSRYFVFYASSVIPDKNGIYFKVSCQAWSYMADKIEKLKLHKGSIVNINANMNAYQKDGRLLTSYEITDINIAEILGNNDNKTTEEPKKADKTDDFLTQLLESPFR